MGDPVQEDGGGAHPDQLHSLFCFHDEVLSL